MLAFAIVAGLSTTATVLASDIETYAPRDSALVFSIRDLGATNQRLHEGPFGALIEQAMQVMAAQAPPEALAEMEGMLGTMTPQGAVGLALFPAMGPDGSAVPGAMLSVDFGEAAGDARKVINDGLQQGVLEGAIELAERELRGRPLREIHIPLPAVPDMGGGDDMGDPMMMDPMAMMMPDPQALLSGFETIYLLWEKDALLVCSSLEALDEALQSAGGDDFNSISRKREFTNLRSQLGTSDAYIAVFPQSIYSLLGPQGMQMGMMMEPMFQQMIGDVRGVGLSVRLDSPGAMMEQAMAVYMPNGRSGLTALIDSSHARGEIPAFVPADALGYSSVAFEFDGVMDLVMPFVHMAAAMGGGDPGAHQQMLDRLGRVLATLGSDIHTWHSLIDSEDGPQLASLRAIACSDTASFKTMLADSAESLSLTPADIEGAIAYEIEPDLAAMMPQMPIPGMPPMGEAGGMPELMNPAGPMMLAIADDHILLGNSRSVRHALSQSGPSLNINSTLSRAMESLPDVPVTAWGFADTAALSTAQMTAQEAMMEQMAGQMDLPGGMGMAMGGMGGLPMEQLSELLKLFGPTAWQITVDQNGFVYRSKTLTTGGD